MSNLRTLKLQLNADNVNLNLASLIRSNHALEHMHLFLTRDLIQASTDGKGSVLRHQLQEELPARLRELTLQGPEIDHLHPAAFKHLRSRRLRLNFHATETLNLDRDLFLNLGRVQNLSVETTSTSNVFNVSEHRTGLRHFGNPVTTYAPNHPRAVFLEHLRIAGNQWPCNCDAIGWTEKWLKRWRGVFCTHLGQSQSPWPNYDPAGPCRAILRDMRSASCQRSKNNVLEDIKHHLECDTFNRSGLALAANMWLLACLMAWVGLVS
eukprot:snap_masked-scaffold1086_size63525-processed-gene-0.1 protein:Tk01502 transcript:snap_masked-scaffold1086_size63525-processed-gene-0.1-mRNA-1 annotation:"hypothetical protein DAPPUDRAFT_119395"